MSPATEIMDDYVPGSVHLTAVGGPLLTGSGKAVPEVVKLHGWSTREGCRSVTRPELRRRAWKVASGRRALAHGYLERHFARSGEPRDCSGLFGIGQILGVVDVLQGLLRGDLLRGDETGLEAVDQAVEGVLAALQPRYDGRQCAPVVEGRERF